MKKIFSMLCIACIALPASADSRWLGDVNGDYNVDEADVSLLAQMLLEEQSFPQDLSLLDVNKDKQVSLSDLTSLIELVNDIREGKKEKEFVPETVDVGGTGHFD